MLPVRVLTVIEHAALEYISHHPCAVIMLAKDVLGATLQLDRLGLIWLKGGCWTVTDEGQALLAKTAI